MVRTPKGCLGQPVFCTKACRNLDFDPSRHAGILTAKGSAFCKNLLRSSPHRGILQKKTKATKTFPRLKPSLPSISIPLLRTVSFLAAFNWHPILSGAAKEWTAQRSVPTIWRNVSEAHLRRLVRNTFSSHNGGLPCRVVLAYCRRRDHAALSARTVRAQG